VLVLHEKLWRFCHASVTPMVSVLQNLHQA
jgi:hypothetical protein